MHMIVEHLLASYSVSEERIPPLYPCATHWQGRKRRRRDRGSLINLLCAHIVCSHDTHTYNTCTCMYMRCFNKHTTHSAMANCTLFLILAGETLQGCSPTLLVSRARFVQRHKFVRTTYAVSCDL